jgi:hypothetical protein
MPLPFQYNPESIKRSLSRASVGGGRKGQEDDEPPQDALRVSGPPKESISLEVRLDAAELKEVASASGAVERYGVLPAIAALERLLSPSTDEWLEAQEAAAGGSGSPFAFKLPLTLLVLGPNRTMPVRLTGLEVEEPLHDTQLNPVVAVVGLRLEVLGSREVGCKGPGLDAFKSYLRNREILADQPLDGEGGWP